MPIKRFVYAAEEVSHAEKDALSCCETGFVMSRKSLFHRMKRALLYCEKACFMTQKRLFEHAGKPFP